MMRSCLGSRSPSRFLNSAALSVAIACGVAGLILSSIALPFAAAQQRGPVQRVVQGKVIDKGETPLSGAVVYLKDDHSLAVKSFIADDKGGYRFGQLTQTTDYEVWAEFQGKKSNTRTISSFDNKNDFVINLKIDTGK